MKRGASSPGVQKKERINWFAKRTELTTQAFAGNKIREGKKEFTQDEPPRSGSSGIAPTIKQKEKKKMALKVTSSRDDEGTGTRRKKMLNCDICLAEWGKRKDETSPASKLDIEGTYCRGVQRKKINTSPHHSRDNWRK